MNESDHPPLILVTTYGPAGEEKYHLPREYVDSVRRAGGACLMLPSGDRRATRLLDLAHAVVLTGGGDINPARYGGPHHETVYMVDDQRDETEIELALVAVERKLPMLAICRGMQILNVALGGSLHPHIPDTFGAQVEHRLPPREPIPHPVSVDQHSRLAIVMGATQPQTMSWHHQALHQVSSALRVVAHAPDGVIEACEMPEHTECLAVQWHPELTAKDDPTQQRLFDWLVHTARRALAK